MLLRFAGVSPLHFFWVNKRAWRRPQKVSGLHSICQIPMIRSRTSWKFVRPFKRMQKRRNVKESFPGPSPEIQGESFPDFHLQARSSSPSICSFFLAVHSWGCLFSQSAFCALEISLLGCRGSGHLVARWLGSLPAICGQHGSNETFRPRRWASGTQPFFLRSPLVLRLKDTPTVGWSGL